MRRPWLKETELTKARTVPWAAAAEPRMYSKLSSARHRSPAPVLLFFTYVENGFEAERGRIESGHIPSDHVAPTAYIAKSMFYFPDESGLSHLVDISECEHIGEVLASAIRVFAVATLETPNIVSHGYREIEPATITELMRLSAPLLSDDAFRFICEELLSKVTSQESKDGSKCSTVYLNSTFHRRYLWRADKARPVFTKDKRETAKTGMKVALVYDCVFDACYENCKSLCHGSHQIRASAVRHAARRLRPPSTPMSAPKPPPICDPARKVVESELKPELCRN